MNVNEEHIAFHSEVGRAIAQWAHVEFSLSWIVGDCFKKGYASQSIVGFRAIENFRSKLQYMDVIMALQNPSTNEKANWTTLQERAGTLATKRNSLVHGWMLTDLERPMGRRIMILPTRPDKKPSPQKYAGAICLRDVAGYRLEFFALTMALDNFRDRLGGRPEQFPKSLELPKRPPTIAQIRSEIYAYASSPPRPSRA